MRVAAFVAVLASACLSAPAWPASPFDGSWDVSVVCPPEKKGALGYSYDFVATVRDGALHGQRGVKGTPSSLTLTGAIAPDGTASLLADGLTGEPEYALGQEEGLALLLPRRGPLRGAARQREQGGRAHLHLRLLPAVRKEGVERPLPSRDGTAFTDFRRDGG